MKKAEYHRYLASREWALLKQQLRLRSAGKCERCVAGAYEQTHHVTYERLGREELSDLLAVCEACHAFLSARSAFDPLRPRDVDEEGNVACYCGSTEMEFEEAIPLYSVPDVPALVLGMRVRCSNGHRLQVELHAAGGVFVAVAPYRCETNRESAIELRRDLPRAEAEQAEEAQCPIGHVRITEALIISGRSSGGGWTRAQLEIIGVPWPPSHGWIHRALGRSIPKEQAAEFVALTGTGRKRRARKEMCLGNA